MKCFQTAARKLLQSKVLLVMKLTVLMMLFFTIHVSAKGFGQDKISLRVKKTEISGVLRSIEQQTTYRFLYNNDLQDIHEKVSLNVKDAAIDEVLSQLLEKTKLLYQVMNENLIVIKEDPNAPVDVVVRGKVTGEGGLPLAGASVQLKGTTTGTSTNNEGNFSITAPDANATLVISSVGYDVKEVALAGQTEINVSLSLSTRVMDQVVVIGYGTASKRDLTGSIAKVSGKEVADKPNTNPVASLQGKVAGLSVVNSGVPGQEPDIRIRGTVSLNQTKPLYVVDGIFNDNINYINPADIESMEILKDPSSLAIFGVRGANGVIIVTTKKGKAGKVAVNLNSSLGFKRIVDKPELTDAAGFKTLYDEEQVNEAGQAFPHYSLFQGNSNWVDLIEKENAIINMNNISLSSGTERNKFYMGVGYIKEQGVIKHEELDKITVTISDELKASKNIKIGFNVNAFRSWLPQVHSFSGALIATPIVEPFNAGQGVYNKLPELMGGPQIGNPLMGVEATKNTSLAREQRFVGSVYGELTFLKYFNFRINLLGDLGFNDGRRYTPLINVYAAEIDTIAGQGGFTRTAVNQYKDNYSKFQQDYLLTFKKQFGDHSLTALAGFTTYFEDFSGLSGTVQQSATGDPIPNDKRWWYLSVFPFGDPSTRVSNSSQWDRSTVSTLFRALYNYKGRYLLNASYRRDGSSEISPNNRYDNFWAVGAAWEIGKENFMSSQTIFDNLKIKASVGKLGNQYNAVHYPYYPGYQPGATAVFGELVVPAYQLAFRNNPTLKWETVNSYEGGIEMDILQRRLHFEANYYNKKTKNLLAFVDDGSDQFYTNSGSIESKGFEFMASWSQTLKPSGLSYTLSANFTTIENEVISIFKPGYTILAGASSRSIEGYPIAHFFGWEHDGLYQSYADKLGSPDASYFGDYGPGDIKFKDLNGDNKIDENDRTIIGNPTPDFTYGFSASANYKGFDISADFQGVYGNEIWRDWGNGNTFAQFNYRAERLKRWTAEGTSNWEPRLTDLAPVNRAASTYMIEDGSYIRLRSLQLGYTFSASTLSKAHITSLRFYISGQNLKTWKRNSGFTPEAGGTATAFGIDTGGYPLPAIMSFGFNITF